ncbi:MAG: hypothetical protein AAGH15_15715, partial [Myxococcota bacterium]
LLGALAFAGGIAAGGLWLFEGVRSGETVLLLAGAGAIALGAGLDLLLALALPARAGRVSVELHLMPRGRLALVGVEREAAELFLQSLRARLARQRPG